MTSTAASGAATPTCTRCSTAWPPAARRCCVPPSRPTAPNTHPRVCPTWLAPWTPTHSWRTACRAFTWKGRIWLPRTGRAARTPLTYVRDPDWDEFRRFQDAAGGRIRLCTLAPERRGALPFIEKLTEAGVVAALGHTGATPETIRDAVRAGARMSTHLGNGSHSRIARHPNYIWEQLAQDALFAGVIADGHHLPASVFKCFARAKGPDRLALVSDAVALGGLPPGVYSEGRHEVLPSGKITLAGTPYLAGAGHLLDACVANALRFSDLSLAQAVRAASSVPARILGLEERKGRLQVGCDADITAFRVRESGPLEIVATVCAGEVIFQA